MQCLGRLSLLHSVEKQNEQGLLSPKSGYKIGRIRLPLPSLPLPFPPSPPLPLPFPFLPLPLPSPPLPLDVGPLESS